MCSDKGEPVGGGRLKKRTEDDQQRTSLVKEWDNQQNETRKTATRVITANTKGVSTYDTHQQKRKTKIISNKETETRIPLQCKTTIHKDNLHFKRRHDCLQHAPQNYTGRTEDNRLSREDYYTGTPTGTTRRRDRSHGKKNE